MSADDREPIVVLVTAPTDVAPALARSLVDARIAACVSITSPIRSIYRWNGQIHDDPEAQLVIKTTRDRFAGLEAHVRANHPYEVPEIIALPITVGSSAYLAWLRADPAD